jgi:glycosyltransferase involved in cell wall biosynthesis
VRARRAADRHGADAFVQLTGWYRPDPGRPAARASYHDGNLATFLDRPDLELDRDRPGVRRALAYERSLYDAMDVILPMSDWLGRSFVEDFGQAPEKVVTAGAGPNFDVLPEPPARDWSRPRLLFVGKDWERKGGPQVLEAFARVRANHPDAELTVIGPTALPVDPPPGVRFLGRLDRAVPEQDAALQDAFGQATAFLMPSIYEPFGIAFLEAMAYGLPCFGGDSCAMPEIIADGVTGHVVRAGDAEALAGPLVALAGDPDRARAMGEAGRERMLARFTWDAVAGRIVDAVGARVQNGAARPTT